LQNIIFLTGSTGFVGTQIAKKIILETDDQIITIVRAESQENAILRLKRTFWEIKELKDQIGKRIIVLNGDLSAPQMNLPDSEYDFVVKTQLI